VCIHAPTLTAQIIPVWCVPAGPRRPIDPISPQYSVTLQAISIIK